MIAGITARLQSVQCCPLCGDDERTPIAGDVSRAPAIVRCSSCETVYASARLSREALDDCCDETVAEPPTSAQHLRMRASLRRYDRLAGGRLARALPGFRALDVGCGNGAMLDVLRDAGYLTEGIECSDSLARQAARRHRIHAVDPCVAGVNLGERYEFILMSHVFEHMPRPTAAMQFVARHLAPGGIVVVEVPNWRDLAPRSEKRRLRPDQLGDHAVFYERKTLRHALESAGLQIRACTGEPQHGARALGVERPTGTHAPAANDRGVQTESGLVSTYVRRFARGLLDRLDPWLEGTVTKPRPGAPDIVAVAVHDPSDLH